MSCWSAACSVCVVSFSLNLFILLHLLLAKRVRVDFTSVVMVLFNNLPSRMEIGRWRHHNANIVPAVVVVVVASQLQQVAKVLCMRFDIPCGGDEAAVTARVRARARARASTAVLHQWPKVRTCRCLLLLLFLPIPRRRAATAAAASTAPPHTMKRAMLQQAACA
jgi:hypothetical protein